jgi:hypothetical protein
MEDTNERKVHGYKFSAELGEWVRDQARRERRWPAHLVADLLRQYRDTVEGGSRPAPSNHSAA